MTKEWKYHKIGIDMSKAYDTIKRQELEEVMTEAGFTHDERRMVPMPLKAPNFK